MRVLKIVGVTLLFVVLCALFLPPLIGIGIEKQADALLMFNANHPQKEIIAYKRGWFSSDVVFKVQYPKVNLQSTLESLLPESTPVPKNLEFIIYAHIQHGPIFYRSLSGFLPFGLMQISRTLSVLPEQQSLATALGLDSSSIKINQSYLGFSGKYSDFFSLDNIGVYASSGVRIHLNNVKSMMTEYPFSHRLVGQITFSGFTLRDDLTSFSLPLANVEFDIKQDSHGFWIGSQTLSLSKIEVQDEDEIFKLTGIELNGGIDASGNSLNANREFSIQKMQFNGEPIGPFHLAISVTGLNAKTIKELLDTYHVISEQGEMYQSQLRQKVFAMLPHVITAGTRIELNDLDVRTPEGLLSADAKMVWPKKNFIQPENFVDLLDTSSIAGNLRVSIPLSEKIVSLIARLTYVYQIPTQDRENLLDMQDQLRLATQLNAYSIMNLIDQNYLPRDEGIDLLGLIRSGVTMEDYQSTVKELLHTRKIGLVTSYQLMSLYNLLYKQYDEFDKKMVAYQKITENVLNKQIQDYLNRGLLVKKNNEYILYLRREKSVLTINGHPVN